MRRWAVVGVGAVVACGLLCSVCVAQEYALKDYIPQAVGCKWTVKSTSGQEQSTLTVEVTETRDIGGQKVPVILTKSAEGVARRGTLELVSDEKYVIYGSLRRPQEGGELNQVLYEPAAAFPGRLALGQSAKATTKMRFGDREFETTMTLTLEAVETVTVPKGAFENCIKLVLSSSTPRGEMKQTFWYAKGIGAVKTERPGFGDRPATVTELVDYQLAK